MHRDGVLPTVKDCQRIFQGNAKMIRNIKQAMTKATFLWIS